MNGVFLIVCWIQQLLWATTYRYNMEKNNSSQDMIAALISKCCHDLSSPLTGAMLAFEVMNTESSDPEMIEIMKNSFDKLSLLLNIWRKCFGSSKNMSMLLSDLQKLAIFNKITITYSSLASTLSEENHQQITEALCLILYILLNHIHTGQSIAVKQINNTITISASNLSSLKIDQENITPSSIVGISLHQFLEKNGLKLSLRNNHATLSFLES